MFAPADGNLLAAAAAAEPEQERRRLARKAAPHADSSSASLGQKQGTAPLIAKRIGGPTGFHAPRRHAWYRVERLGLSGKLCKMA